MSTCAEDRLARLEERLALLEDERDILRLLATYGPLVDGGEASAAAGLYLKGGTLQVEGYAMQVAPADVHAGLDCEAQRRMNAGGCMHLVGAPRVRVAGNSAEASTYNLVVLNKGGEFAIWRAAVNRWSLVRTQSGWKVAARFSNAIDGSEAARALILAGLTGAS